MAGPPHFVGGRCGPEMGCAKPQLMADCGPLATPSGAGRHEHASTRHSISRAGGVVTGAGNGIGRAIAQALVGEGVRTVFADVNRETVTAAIERRRVRNWRSWVGDLADPAARDALLVGAAGALGRVTHFVHSASPPRREADHVLGVTTETWARMHAVNLEAGFISRANWRES